MGQCRSGVGLGAGLLIALGAAAAFAACPTDQIEIKTADSSAIFTVEVVDDYESRARGLMFREDMARDHGMLFVYDRAEKVSFWMKNTPLPLDIVFLNRKGVICSIAKGTTPFSEAPIPSRCAAQTVLEVNAGEADAQGLRVGAPARHPAIAAPAWACE